MNNEPVAWLVQYSDFHEFKWDKPTDLQGVVACEPLYTHPVKELTDEEIIWVYQNLWRFLPSEEPDLAKDIKKFARAILRKVQEK